MFNDPEYPDKQILNSKTVNKVFFQNFNEHRARILGYKELYISVSVQISRLGALQHLWLAAANLFPRFFCDFVTFRCLPGMFFCLFVLINNTSGTFRYMLQNRSFGPVTPLISPLLSISTW